MDKKDIELMKLKDTKRSQTSGNVFANSKGVKDYHPLGSIPLESFEGKSIDDLLSSLFKKIESLEKQLESQKRVLKHQRTEIQKTKGVLEKYGL